MKKNLFILASLVVSNGLIAQTQTDTLFFTGSEQMWVVPCGAQNVSITTYGAQGASGSSIYPGVNVGGQAGLGNKVVGSWSMLVPTDTIYVYVGGQAIANVGGYNGGGNGVANPAANPSGGGGGATDVRWPSNALNDRVQVAGGGGGGGNAGLESSMNPITGGNGGNGGGNQLLFGNSLDGQSGTDVILGSFVFPSASGGTTSGVGIHGNGCSGFLGLSGGSNNSNIGGNGGQGNNGFGAAQTTMAPSGGGGGGGFIGGNGGGGGSAGTSGCQANGFGPGGGGAAGSNYFDGPVTGENGIWSGNGMVIISYEVVIDSAEIFPLTSIPCQGQSIALSVSPAGGVFSSNLASTFLSNEFTPTTSGNYEIYYTYTSCGVTTVDTVFALINEIQTANIAAFVVPCVGDSINLIATPGGGVFTSTIVGAISGTPIDGYTFNPASETTYEIIYATNSCAVQITDTMNVVVNCDVTGIETNVVEFSVYPNPAKEQITINTTSTIEEIVIVDVFGKRVKVFSNDFDKISVSDLTNGVYFIQVKNEEEQLSRIVQFIKE
ncbi:MAG: T9SS type A sorting domain-containing protein [Fluviicola sp.]|jgi:hypothetical protein